MYDLKNKISLFTERTLPQHALNCVFGKSHLQHALNCVFEKKSFG